MIDLGRILLRYAIGVAIQAKGFLCFKLGLIEWSTLAHFN